MKSDSVYNKLSNNFIRKEFVCKCGCGFSTVDISLVRILQDLREYFASPVTITSGCRCLSYNLKINGAINSYHTIGKAADIVVEGFSPEIVGPYLESKYGDFIGLGIYKGWVHVDVRGYSARW